MRVSDLDGLSQGPGTIFGLGRPFPVRWLLGMLAGIIALLFGAVLCMFSAQSTLASGHWVGGDTPLHQVRGFLYVALGFRALALVLIVTAVLILSRWAIRLEKARAAAETIAAELREQKKELSTLNRKLFDEARIDPLTQLQTRLRLTEDLETLWSEIERDGDCYCAVMCDVDRFKEYNDGYGHVAGDEALRKVAAALLQGCRVGDRLYRYGGEEFLLLLRAGSTLEALTMADRHRVAVEMLRMPHFANESGMLTVSMGVAPLWTCSRRSATEWIEQADLALYKAKRTGRNCIAVLGDEGLMKAVA